MTGIGGLAAVAVAGLGAGTIDAVVGSGTLITFPVLVSLGIPPVTADVTNAIGLVPGGFSGIWGYRRELAGPAGPADPVGVGLLHRRRHRRAAAAPLPAGMFALWSPS